MQFRGVNHRFAEWDNRPLILRPDWRYPNEDRRCRHQRQHFAHVRFLLMYATRPLRNSVDNLS